MDYDAVAGGMVVGVPVTYLVGLKLSNRVGYDARGESLRDSALSSRAAIRLTFFSSPPLKPKKVAICAIWAGLTKSFGSEQNLSIEGSNSRQLIPLGVLSPRRHLPSC